MRTYSRSLEITGSVASNSWRPDRSGKTGDVGQPFIERSKDGTFHHLSQPLELLASGTLVEHTGSGNDNPLDMGSP